MGGIMPAFFEPFIILRENESDIVISWHIATLPDYSRPVLFATDSTAVQPLFNPSFNDPKIFKLSQFIGICPRHTDCGMPNFRTYHGP